MADSVRWAFFAVTILAWMLCGSPAFAVSIPPFVKNLSVWYDASNAATITQASQTVVTQWNDKSSSGGHNLTASTGTAPTYTTNSINGLSTLTFNGTSQYLSVTTGFPTSSDYTIFAVVKFNAAGGNNIFSGIAASGTSHALWGNGGTAPQLYQGSASFVTGSDPGTSTFLVTAAYTNSSGSGSIYLNGNTAVTGTTTNKPVTDASIEVGAYTQAQFLNGQIGEVFVYAAVPTPTNRQKLEGYLACKWGLQGSLPAGHPYKSTCSGVQAPTFTPNSVASLNAWYDASDATSMTTTVSNPVSQWNDLSGNSKNLTQAVLADQPNYLSSGINGLGSLSFNGTSTFLTAANGFPTNSDYTIAGVAQFTAVNTNSILAGYTASSSVSYAFWGASAETPALYQAVGTAGGTFATAASVGTSPFLALGTVQDSNGAGNMYVNGGTPATGTAANLHVADSSIEVGGYDGAGRYLSGTVGELLVYSRVLSTAERQYIEGYLACKWGLQSSLPSGHPYKSTCPSGTNGLTLSAVVSPTGAQVPGTVLTYTTTYTNGAGIIDYNPVLTAPVPSNMDFQLSSASSNQSTTGLPAPTVTYSNDSGSTYAYTPVSGAGGAPGGYDRTVTNIRWTFSGTLGCGSSNNSGTISFSARIR